MQLICTISKSVCLMFCLISMIFRLKYFDVSKFCVLLEIRRLISLKFSYLAFAKQMCFHPFIRGWSGFWVVDESNESRQTNRFKSSDWTTSNRYRWTYQSEAFFVLHHFLSSVDANAWEEAVISVGEKFFTSRITWVRTNNLYYALTHSEAVDSRVGHKRRRHNLNFVQSL